MTELCLIAGVSRNGIIGANGGIPWHLSEDFKYFKRVTTGYPTLMGRKTYESIGKALPGRPAYVVSTTLRELPDAVVVNEMDLALEQALHDHSGDKIFVIGGEALYQYFLDKADVLYLTLIEENFEGDAKFPWVANGEFSHDDWVCESSEAHEGKDPERGTLKFSFNTYRRKQSQVQAA